MNGWCWNRDNNVAIGWVHNRNAWVMNSFYLATGLGTTQNFLGCMAPTSQSIELSGFQGGADYFVTWFPTRMNSTVYPPDMVVTSSANGTISLNLTGHFGGIQNNYLDTLRSDYAFLIGPWPIVKSMATAQEHVPEVGWDFHLYPNPAREELFLQLPDDTPKEITVWDVWGRVAVRYQNITTPLFHLTTTQFAKGAYWVRVSDGEHWKVKKLIIH
jgi:hypothetical protein